MQDETAVERAIRFVETEVVPRRCDSDGVSNCLRCNAIFLAKCLHAERVKNLELQRVIQIEREFSANLKRKTYDAVQAIQSIFEESR